MKIGMLPGYQILTFAGPVLEAPPKPDGYEVAPLTLDVAREIDEKIRDTGREEDHRFWLFQLKVNARQVTREGRIVGYYYLNGGGVGPAAWLEPQDSSTLMSLACREAAEQPEPFRLLVPGINHDAIRFAFKIGLRFTAFSHLLTSAPFGQLDQYLTSGPSLF
jgi:hypothetical protein